MCRSQTFHQKGPFRVGAVARAVAVVVDAGVRGRGAGVARPVEHAPSGATPSGVVIAVTAQAHHRNKDEPENAHV